jgi:hypothetical protein
MPAGAAAYCRERPIRLIKVEQITRMFTAQEFRL